MIFDWKVPKLVKAMRHRRVDFSVFDNWYVHCPKCGGLLNLLMGADGPTFVCLCPRKGSQETGVRRQGSGVRGQESGVKRQESGVSSR
jgi:hypothetical protein